MTLKHEIKFTPAYDNRDAGYGIHGVDITWYVIGDAGAIQFVLFTGWHLEHIEREMEETTRDRIGFSITRPVPADLGYHAKVAQYEGHTPMDKCHLLPEGKCYYDGSTTQAETPFRILKEEGGEALWNYLDHVYAERFHLSEAKP